MRKLTKITFRGIEYIRLSSLSAVHAESLGRGLDNRTMVKILKNDIVLTDCVLYSVYEVWYNSFVKENPAEPIFEFPKQFEPSLTPA